MAGKPGETPSPRLADPAEGAGARSMVVHPEWTRTGVLYQLNTRQFTAEGTFAAAAEHLERLARLGVRCVWLMPVHPIGEVERKGRLGSPYAVRDHQAVNSEFGSLEDLRAFVERAHSLGLDVILDWVANHTAHDHPWVTEHPDWYRRDREGRPMSPPWCDWDDVLDLDLSQPEARRAMAEALRFWVEEVGVDGFRCDVAGFVPLGFWEEVRAELEATRPLFLLAEWEERDLHARAFDATYGWTWHKVLVDIAQGRADARALEQWASTHVKAWSHGGQRMLFVSNHDKNAWEGAPEEQFGAAVPLVHALAFLMEGLPMVHNGDEVGQPRRLAFFERDPIRWNEGLLPLEDWLGGLARLRTEHPALHAPPFGGPLQPVGHDQRGSGFAFLREAEGEQVLVLANLTGRGLGVRLTDADLQGPWREVWGLVGPMDQEVQVTAADPLGLTAWGVRVLVRTVE